MAASSQQGEFCWNELITHDAEKAKKFYNKLLGWTYEDHPLEGGPTYTMILCKDKMAGGIMQCPQTPPHWMGYIAVDDIDGIVREAKSLGATIEIPVQAVGNFGRFAVIKDPTGANIAFWESAKQST